METCPACLGPNPDCDTCHGSGEVIEAVAAAFLAAQAQRLALAELALAADTTIRDAATVEEAKAALAALIGTG